MISTKEDLPEGTMRDNEPDQMDATYLAVNLAYLPKRAQQSFNMDTRNSSLI